MRITMFAIGSTGDVLPYIVLGRELHRRGHQVTICAFPDFEKQITDAGLLFTTLSGNSKEFISTVMSGSVGVGFLLQAYRALRDLAEPMMEDIKGAAQNAEAVISTYLGDVYQMTAEDLHLPYIQTQYFPMEETADFPITAAPFLHLGRMWNITSYRLGYWLISAIEKHLLDPSRKKKGLPSLKRQFHRNYQVNGHTFPVIYAVPDVILPRPKEWKKFVFMTGYWREAPPYTPDEKLVQFLRNGPPPLYIGFGSMNGKQLDFLMPRILEALKITGLRAVIATGWGNASVSENQNLFYVRYVSHDWLFPKIRAAVHHGGAGTMAACLYAGKPMLVVPFGGDQPFWGEQVWKMGLGPKAIPVKRMRADTLAKALRDLCSNPLYQRSANEIREKLVGSHPVQDAADIIEKELKTWTKGRDRV